MDKQATVQAKLDVALAEIQRLYGAAAATAEAVTKAIPRQEAEDAAVERAEAQKRTLFFVSGGHLVLMVLLLWAFTAIGVTWVRSSIERDHAILRCLATTTEKVKVADPRMAVTRCVTSTEE